MHIGFSRFGLFSVRVRFVVGSVFFSVQKFQESVLNFYICFSCSKIKIIPTLSSVEGNNLFTLH